MKNVKIVFFILFFGVCLSILLTLRAYADACSDGGSVSTSNNVFYCDISGAILLGANDNQVHGSVSGDIQGDNNTIFQGAHGTITGNVYVDTNSNANKDTIETSYLSGATVNLGGTASRSITTDSSGNYRFSNLYQSNYNITLTLPGGYKNITHISGTITFL